MVLFYFMNLIKDFYWGFWNRCIFYADIIFWIYFSSEIYTYLSCLVLYSEL